MLCVALADLRSQMRRWRLLNRFIGHWLACSAGLDGGVFFSPFVVDTIALARAAELWLSSFFY
jgi:hypothetical protein